MSTENVAEAILQQNIRRRTERQKIALIASTDCENIHQDFDAAAAAAAAKENLDAGTNVLASAASNNSNTTRRPPSPLCHSPTTENSSNAQLKARIATLEEETAQMRAVIDLARRENFALKTVLEKVAVAALGYDYKAKCGITAEEGILLAGTGQPGAELTVAQRERLLGLLGGAEAHLLP